MVCFHIAQSSFLFIFWLFHGDLLLLWNIYAATNHQYSLTVDWQPTIILFCGTSTAITFFHLLTRWQFMIVVGKIPMSSSNTLFRLKFLSTEVALLTIKICSIANVALIITQSARKYPLVGTPAYANLYMSFWTISPNCNFTYKFSL